MANEFTATRKSSKANILTDAIRTSRIDATTIDEAVAAAQVIADAEVGMVELRYGGVHVRTVRASRKAVAEHDAWLASRKAPFSGGPGSASIYNSAWQCSPRCEGTKDNPCMVAVNRCKGVN